MNWLTSVGEKCEHQPIGATFYEATGPAFEAFELIASHIFKIVEVSKLDLERGIRTCPSAEIRLFMISKNKIPSIFTSPALESSIKRQARPTIVILSASKLYRKRVIALLRKDKQLEKHPEFGFAGFSRDPAKPMARSASHTIGNAIRSIYVCEESPVESGISLLFSTGKTATLGGIITINGTEYGMTAYHACIDPKVIHEDLSNVTGELCSDKDDDDHSSDFDDYDLEREGKHFILLIPSLRSLQPFADLEHQKPPLAALIPNRFNPPSVI